MNLRKQKEEQRRGEERRCGEVVLFAPPVLELPRGSVRPCVRVSLGVPSIRFNARGEPTASLPMNRLSLRNNRSKFKTSGELPIILGESMKEYTSKS